MKRSVKVSMLTISALTGLFVFTGLSGVKVLSKVASEELLTNSSFEDPAVADVGILNRAFPRPTGWQMFTSGTAELMTLAVGPAHSGNQAVKFVSHGVPDFYQGFNQAVSVNPGETYQFSVYAKGDAAHPLKNTITGQLSIEWHGAGDEEIGRLWSPAWDATLPATEWTKFEVAGAAPPACAKAHCVIVEKGHAQPVAGGVFFVDDASFVKVTE